MLDGDVHEVNHQRVAAQQLARRIANRGVSEQRLEHRVERARLAHDEDGIAHLGGIDAAAAMGRQVAFQHQPGELRGRAS
jgi:hypothetical protein